MTQENSKKDQSVRNKSAKFAINKQDLLRISLALNVIFVVMAIGVLTITNTRSFWNAKVAYQMHQRTCPKDTAGKTETNKKDGITTTTIYVSAKALESGCVDDLLEAAQVDDYRAHPEKAKADADQFRKLSDDGSLHVTVIKSLENNTQLAPLKIEN